jgi:prepilin-type N-terminal cleavage/methylation domain-containing protein
MLIKNRQICRTKLHNRQGLTLVELMLASVIGGIVMLGIGISMSDSNRGFKEMYNHIYSDVISDSQAAKRMFDARVRQSNCYKAILDLDENRWVEVQYYANSSSTSPDRYTTFYYEDTHLYAEYGRILSSGIKETIDFRPVCGNVQNCSFKQTGRSLQMILTLNNGSHQVTTVTSAVMHN